jgi:valyl-tRNA synthetase
MGMMSQSLLTAGSHYRRFSFVLDDRGHKMSKSLDNGVDPSLVIEGGKNKKVLCVSSCQQFRRLDLQLHAERSSIWGRHAALLGRFS